MKKITIGLGPIFLITLVFAVFSCQKDRDVMNAGNPEQVIAANSQGQVDKGPVTRAYRDSFDIDLNFKPDIAAGWKYPSNSPAWFYGTGTGNATHMGNATIYLNSYTLRNSAGVVMVYGRPLSQFYASKLPPGVDPNASAVMIDKDGNAIWANIAPEGLPSRHIDANYVTMEGKIIIAGGTGKFKGATGETTVHAIFNQFDLTEASIWQNGRISY